MEHSKRHRIVWKLLRPFARLLLKCKFNYSSPVYAPKGPFIVLCNHVTDWDPIFVGAAFKEQMYFVTSEHLLRLGFVSKLIMWLQAPIARQKGGSAAGAVKAMLRAMKEGHNIGLFPEGNRTWDGVTRDFPASTGKLVRSCGGTLVTFRLSGGYFASPRWAGASTRKGRMRGQVVGTYSPEELRLIFRHELIHIGREDSSSKFFLMFCTAMCWFNPLMWIAMRKSADDLELSCDETVLLDADGDTRRQYAGLLLDAAGDERGFTTCLSAGAAAMRYRMRAIVKPPRRHSGALVIGLVFFALCMTGGYVTLSYGGSTGEDVLFRHQDHSLFQLRSISQQNDAFHTTYICTDEDAFKAYLAGLETDILAGNYSFSGNGRQFTFLFDTPQGTLGVLLSDNVLKLVPLYEETPSPSSYYLPRGAGWDCLDAIILAAPAMNVHLNRAGEPYGRDISATLDRLSVTEHNVEQLLYSSGLSEEEINGIWGYGPCEATLSFSCPPPCCWTDCWGNPRPVSIPSAAWGPWPPSWNESSAAVPTGHA